MFFPCTIKDSKGKVKKVVTAKQLSKKHWKDFQWSYQHGTLKNLAPTPGADLRSEKADDPNFYLP